MMRTSKAHRNFVEKFIGEKLLCLKRVELATRKTINFKVHKDTSQHQSKYFVATCNAANVGFFNG